MKALLTTYRYGEASPEEELEQSNTRLEALRKIADFIDSPIDKQLGQIVDEFINEPDYHEHSYEEFSSISSSRNDFFKMALQTAIEEQKKAELKTKIICLLYEKIDYMFYKYSDFNKNFPTETRKTVEKAIQYANYAIDVVASGRSVKDIFELSFDKICEIANCEQPERWKDIEEFVLKEKVGIKYLKRIIQLVNEDDTVELYAAFEQATNEAKAKREDVKTGNALERRYKLLKKRYKWLEEGYDDAWAAHKESEKLRRKFQHRSEKWSKLNAELNEQIKAIKKALRKKFPEITEIKNIVYKAEKNITEQETKNNIITEIVSRVEYYPMVI